jgi:hypothetical protein
MASRGKPRWTANLLDFGRTGLIQVRQFIVKEADNRTFLFSSAILFLNLKQSARGIGRIIQGGNMRLNQVLYACTLVLFTAAGYAAPKEKDLVCHVDSETGNINLIVVSKKANHLGNPAHSYDGISDFQPELVEATGDSTEDSNGDGIDDGCEPSQGCPCWAKMELFSVTADNNHSAFSCSTAFPFPEGAVIRAAVIQNYTTAQPASVEGGFGAVRASSPDGLGYCNTRDIPPNFLDVTDEEAVACIDQIVARCAAIGDPIVLSNQSLAY